MTELLLDALLDALLDSAKLLPFLYITYLIMEYLEDHASHGSNTLIKKAGWLGPLWGGLLGLFPQCGFSAAAANLYAGRAISLGTLLAIFLATSDEMLPIMLSESVAVMTILHILLIKATIGMIAGFCIDGFCHMLSIFHTGQAEEEDLDVERLCEKAHCHCEEGNIFKSAFHHTLSIIGFLFLITLGLNLLFSVLGEDAVAGLLTGSPVAGIFSAALVGLIPNCAASVVLTELFLHGVLLPCQLIAGLLVGAGVGLLICFRVNPDQKENVRILVLLYALGVIGGLLVYWLGITI